MGPVNVLQLKSATGARTKRNVRKCGFCGLPGHTYNGSYDLHKKLGNCVPQTQIYQLVADLTSHCNPHFITVTFEQDSLKIQIVDQEKNFICIHGYANQASIFTSSSQN